jgi:hypothetical protein
MSGRRDAMEIKDLIADLRSQLEALDKERQDSSLSPLFVLSSVEVELSFVVKENEDTKVGFDLKIVSANMGGAHAQESIQKLKISLVPYSGDDTGPLGTRYFDRTTTSDSSFKPLE